MKFEQLIEEMKKHSYLSSYYFEMLKSIGWDWEEFLKEWYWYTRMSEKDKRILKTPHDRLISKAQKFGERLGYIFKCVREDSEKQYEKHKEK